MTAEYSTDLLLHAAGRLTDADSFAHGLRLLTANYNLLSESDALVVSWHDSGRNVVEEVFATSYALDLFPAGLSRPVENTGVKHFLEHGASLIQERDLEKIAREGNIDFEKYAQASVLSIVGIPIIWRLQTIGVVQLLRTELSGPVQMAFMERLAVLIAPHLALIKSSNTEQSIRDLYSALSDIAGLIATGSDLHVVLERVASHAKNLVGFDSLAIRILDDADGGTEPEYQQGAIDLTLLYDEEAAKIGMRITKVAKAHKGAFCLAIDDTSLGPNSESEIAAILEHVPSVLIAPMRSSGKFVGTIECYSLNEWAYGVDDIEKLEQLADFALHGIRQSQMVENLGRQLTVRQSIAEIARISAIGTDTRSVLTEICKEMTKLVDFDHLTFYLPDPLISMVDGLHTAVGDASYSAIAHSTIEQLDISEIESVTAHLTVDIEASFTVAAELWEQEGKGAAYVALSRNTALTDQEISLFHEAARHIGPAVKNLMLRLRDAQLLEETQRAEEAESSATHFREVDRIKKEILSTVTHEIRSPLASITAFVDMLRRNPQGNLSDEQLQNLDVVRRGTLAVSNIVGDLDELASLETSKMELFYQESSVNDLAKNLARDMKPQLQSTGHQLRLTLPARDVMCSVDRVRISQVLSNLVSNASKYSPQDSLIRLLVRVSGDHVHMFVKDQGAGIPLHEQKDLFGLFSRAESQLNGPVSGSGVGLYVCKKIVEAHGGQINLHSEPGKGTTVHFWVPLSGGEAVQSSSDQP